MARPNNFSDVDTWRLADTCARFCSCAFRLHSLLVVVHVYLRYFCFYHLSAACLLKDGEIIAAAQEERFTRKKHDAAFLIMQFSIA